MTNFTSPPQSASGLTSIDPKEVAKFSAADAQALPEYYAMLERVAGVLREMLPVTPPNIRAGNAADLAAIVDMFKVGKRFRALSLPERRDLLDLFAKSAGDLLDQVLYDINLVEDARRV